MIGVILNRYSEVINNVTANIVVCVKFAGLLMSGGGGLFGLGGGLCSRSAPL